MNKKVKYLPILFLVLVSCQKTGPIKIEAGKHKCKHCKMNIIDLRFNSQVITEKGKIHHFDSTECVLRWLRKNKNPKQQVWVANSMKQNFYLNAKNSVFLQSDRFASPMGEGISAYKDMDSLKNIKSKFGGNIYSFKKLVKYLKQKDEKTGK